MLLSLAGLTRAGREKGGREKPKERKKEKKRYDGAVGGREEYKRARKRDAALKIRNANSIMTHSFPRPGKRASRGKMSSAAN